VTAQDTEKRTPNVFLGCALVISAIAAAAVVLGIYAIFFAGPAVSIDSRGTTKVIDLHFLGEYCIGVSRIRLIDAASKQVVWEVAAIENQDTGICQFILAPGRNSVRVGQPSDLKFAVVHPRNGLFDLLHGRRYEFTVWGNNGFARWGRTRRTFRM
jgi:hypothetical protein